MSEPESKKQNEFKTQMDAAPTISIKEAVASESGTSLAQANSSGELSTTSSALPSQPGKDTEKKSRFGRVDKEDVFIGLILAGVAAAALYFHWGPFARPKIDYHKYVVTVQSEIKNHWHPPDTHNDNRVQIHFKIQKNGEVTDVGLSRMSHIPDADAAALKALLEAMPAMPPLPDGSDAPVDMDFSFEQTYTHGK